eukprot:NODE_302_length_11399_cov_0.339115.p7 type:complete len:197 gc:universal NODE_302_length_11399_cov_0.339115:8210-7620(-)
MTQQSCSWGECNMTFPNSEQLYEHLVNRHIECSKTGSSEYRCNWLHCSVSVTKRYRIISHLLCHVSYRPFLCPHCDKRFKRSHDARKHVKLIHEMNSSQLYYKRGKSKSRSSDSSPDLKSCDDYISQTSSLSPNMELSKYRLPSLNFCGSKSKPKNSNESDRFSESFLKLVDYCLMIRSSEFKENDSIKTESVIYE